MEIKSGKIGDLIKILIMKKILFLSLVLFGFVFSNAQEISKNAIGLRFGGGDGFGTEVNYQRALGGNNRLELGLGFITDDDYDGFQLSGIYQWVWNLDGNFNWYAGPGAGITSREKDNGFIKSSETSIFLVGQVGIEYNFDFPLLLSLDTRPVFDFGDFREDFGFDIALAARYRF